MGSISMRVDRPYHTIDRGIKRFLISWINSLAELATTSIICVFFSSNIAALLHRCRLSLWAVDVPYTATPHRGALLVVVNNIV